MDIEALIGYRFKNKALLEEALTHPSRAEIREDRAFNYQRLEFLGDTVLGLVVAELLYGLYPEEDEGSLAKRHAALVRSEALAGIARALGLGEHILLSGGEEGRDITSNLEDVCEALMGALYLDGGLEPARAFILHHWEPLARATPAPPKDAKTELQEWAQGRGLALPHYKVLKTIGPAHAPEFTISVSVEGFAAVTGTATSKRQAEQLAARTLLEQLEGA